MDVEITGTVRAVEIQKVGKEKNKDLFVIHVEQIGDGGVPRISRIKSFDVITGKYDVGKKYTLSCFDSLQVWKDKVTGEAVGRVDYMLKSVKGK